MTPVALRTTVSQALRSICRAEQPALPDHAQLQSAFVQAARHHRVAPLAHVAMRDTAPGVAQELRSDRDVAMTTHISATVVLDALGELFHDLRWVTFKGAMLSEHAHPAPGLRSYNDVDVLVSPAQLRPAAHRLLDAGWRIADYQDMLCNANVPGEMHWVSPSGVLVDLHWSMINMATTRRHFTLPTDELLDRRVNHPLGPSSAWALDRADALVHVCLHAALTGANRMLLVLDADQLARRIADWDAVVARARRWGAAPALAIVLQRARTFLSTPLPDDLGRELGVSSGFSWVTRAVDRLAPVPRLHREASLARLVARSTRPSGVRTLVAAGRRGLHGLVERLSADRSQPTVTRRQPADLAALESYLRSVEHNLEGRPS